MRILATTDGSEHSFQVLPHVRRLAAALDAETTLLRVLDPRLDAAGVLDPSLSHAIDQVRASWEEEMRGLLAVHGLVATPRVERKTGKEASGDTILRVADELGAGLIAMDTRGAGFMRHALLGSTAMHIIQKSCYPVLLTNDVVQPPATEDTYHVVITNDGSPAALDVLRGLAPLLRGPRARATLLRVYEPRIGDADRATEMEAAQVQLERVREMFAGAFAEGLEVAIAVEAARDLRSVASEIIRVAGELGADAIAMSTHGHSAMRRLFTGSVAAAVLKSAPLPMIVARCSTRMPSSQELGHAAVRRVIADG